MVRPFGFRVKRIGTIKRAPMWGDAVVNEIIGVLEEPQQVPLGQELDRIVANWDNKPGFVVRVALNKGQVKAFEGGAPYQAGSITLSYRTTGPRKARQIWEWLNQGTRPHKIRAKNAPRLAFEWSGPGSYQPKTKPGGRSLQFGGPGIVSGGKMHYPAEVQHPGTEPRDFDGWIQRKLTTKFRSAVQLAIKKGLARANRGQTFKRI